MLLPSLASQGRVARLARDLALMAGFAALTALCAQVVIRVPWTVVPITGQTFAVLIAGGALGAWRGAGSMSLYLLAGMVLPVFAPPSATTGGEWDAHFVLPWSGTEAMFWQLASGGYIVGFIVAAAVVGWFAERGFDRKPWVHVGLLAGTVVIYLFGVGWLAYLIETDWVAPGASRPLGEVIAGSGTLDKALKGGLYPFIVGDLMKVQLAALALPLAWAVAGRRQRPGSPTAT